MSVCASEPCASFGLLLETLAPLLPLPNAPPIHPFPKMHPLDCRFAMRLGSNYFTLYIASLPLAAATMHFKDTALQTKAQIVLGAGPTLGLSPTIPPSNSS